MRDGLYALQPRIIDKPYVICQAQGLQQTVQETFDQTFNLGVHRVNGNRVIGCGVDVGLVQRDINLGPDQNVRHTRFEIVGEIVGKNLQARLVLEQSSNLLRVRGERHRVQLLQLICVPTQPVLEYIRDQGTPLRLHIKFMLTVLCRDLRGPYKLVQLPGFDVVFDLIPGDRVARARHVKVAATLAALHQNKVKGSAKCKL